MKIGQADP